MARNNHYHYAEKFDANRRKKVRRVFVPKRTAIMTTLFLLMFGIISTTFAAYISSAPQEDTHEHTIFVDVRTAKAERDIALTGREADLAETGGYFKGYMYWADSVSWGASQLYMWNGNWNTSWNMTQIAGTNIYYLNFTNQYGFEGFKFRKDSGWSAQSSGNLTVEDSNGPRWVNGTSTTVNSGTGNLNGKLNITTLISYDGGANYSPVANGNIYTSVSLKEFNYAANKTATTDRTGNTQSNSTYTHYPAYGSSYTITANYPSGVSFRGFYNNDGETPSAAAASNTKTETASELNNGEINWYAYYVVPYVTDADKSPSYIADASTKPSITYRADGQFSYADITAPSISGYTFSGWSFSAGSQSYSTGNASQNPISVCTTADCTATASYTINPPTAVSIDDISSYTAGDSAVSLNPTVTIAAAGATAVNTYTIEDASGNPVVSGASVDASGNFSATVPGVYTVTLSSQAQKTSGGNSITSSSATTDTATVTVYPAKPAWTLTMSGFDANGSLNNGEVYGSELNPYLVTLGSSFSFTAAITNPLGAGYTYTWYNAVDDSVLGTGSSLTFGSGTASEATLADVHVEVYCKVTYEYDATNHLTVETDSDSAEKYYYIKSLINIFEIPDMQKIYATPNDAIIKLSYNIASAAEYTTKLYASSDNVNFYEAASVTGFLGTLVGTAGSGTEYYTYDPAAQMVAAGLKYFFVQMSKTGANAKTDVIHTTVGASTSTGNRTIYFVNGGAALDLANYRVMAFYIDGNGDVKYQTAQDVFKGRGGSGNSAENKRFRVSIPANATKIAFAVARKSRYLIPEWDGTNFDFTGGNSSPDENRFYIAYTGVTNLDLTKNTIIATGKTLVSGYTDTGDTPNPYYTLTTTYNAVQTTS